MVLIARRWLTAMRRRAMQSSKSSLQHRRRPPEEEMRIPEAAVIFGWPDT